MSFADRRGATVSRPELSSSERISRRSLSGIEYHPGELVVGKYRLDRVLGAGGMGAVWLAQNEMLDVPVALKLIRDDVQTQVARQRFLREARAAARLDHPSIVRVFDYGETGHGDPFLVMEAVEGPSMADLLSRFGKLTPAEAVRLVLPIASALESAHARGVIHRDVKPENVLVVRERDGRAVPKVLDFGVAKLVSQSDEQGPITDVGTVVGSPEYMSPEQMLARPDLDGRSDVWSLSVTLYELLTGQRPFEGDGCRSIFSAALHRQPVPITELGADDAELWAIVARGLAKDRDQRWGSMRELGDALAAWGVARGIDTDASGFGLATRASRSSLPSLTNAASGELSTCPTAPDHSLRLEPLGRRQPARWRALLALLALGALLGFAASSLWWFGR